MIYSYGEVMKHIGRCETNEKTTTKEYNKLIAEKESIIKKFDEHFNSSIKFSKVLNIT